MKQMTGACCVAAALLSGCAITQEEVVQAERGQDVEHWFQVVPRKPDVAAYPGLPEHVLTVPRTNRDYITVKVLNYPKERKFMEVQYTREKKPILPVATVAPLPPPTMSPAPEVVVQFGFDSARLNGSARKQLDAFLKRLSEAGTGVSLMVDAHTDSAGTDEYNQKLSGRRAAAVKQYLVEKGLANKSIALRGHGEAEPVANNEAEDGRAKNRRAEVHIDGSK